MDRREEQVWNAVQTRWSSRLLIAFVLAMSGGAVWADQLVEYWPDWVLMLSAAAGLPILIGMRYSADWLADREADATILALRNLKNQ